MTLAVVDASVIVKTIVDQELTANARSAVVSFDLAAPALLAAETASALLKYVRARCLSSTDALAALETIGRHAIDFHPIDDALTRDAFAIADALSHSVYDCYYLSLARSLKAPLITADRKLLRRAMTANFEVIGLGDIRGE